MAEVLAALSLPSDNLTRTCANVTPRQGLLRRAADAPGRATGWRQGCGRDDAQHGPQAPRGGVSRPFALPSPLCRGTVPAATPGKSPGKVAGAVSGMVQTTGEDGYGNDPGDGGGRW